MNNITFSVIIAWKSGNPQREAGFKNLLNCLKSQESDNPEYPIVCELVIVEQVTSETSYQANKTIKDILPQEFAGAKYIQLLHDSMEFNKSWCYNVGVKEAFHEHLIFMDADSLFGKDYINLIRDHVRNTHEAVNKLMLCWNKLICMPGKDNPVVRYITPLNTNALGAIWYTEKKYFLKVLGGMNENYVGYGGEDNDIYQRAVYAQKSSIVMMPYTLIHQYHDWIKPAFNADYLFNISLQNTYIITERLKSTNIGNKFHPTLIDMDDLPWT